MTTFEYVLNNSYEEGYNKAINDFEEKLLKQKIIDTSVIRRIAEQLKRGEKNVR